MSAMLDLQAELMALLDADLKDLERVRGELVALGEGKLELARIDALIERKRQMCAEARAALQWGGTALRSRG